MKTVLTIAGFDPSSGAGITADLMVFAAHGLFGTSAITALTVQSTLGVQASHPVDAEILRTTLECLSEDLPPAGVKLGLVGYYNICEISRYIDTIKAMDSESGGVPVVLDPILVSSSGKEFLGSEEIERLKGDLLPRVDWVTPNADELSTLIGLPVRNYADLAAAARQLQAQSGAGRRGQRLGVLAKGGHLERPDDLVLTPAGTEHWLRGEHIETTATHGTGCARSSAFLCGLVLGDSPIDAARKAKEYVAEAMRRAPGMGGGKAPMSLLWPLHGGAGR
jgi:hydroxymethylpyrimidine/phosphomethylpyrimidine kinase